MQRQNQIILACVYTLIFSSSVLSVEVDIKKVISFIEKKEASINSMAWKCEEQIEDVAANHVTKKGTAEIVFDKEGRFRLAKQEIRQWVDGPDPDNSVTILATFDGTVFRTEEKSVPGIKMPSKENIARGTISKDTRNINEYINWRGLPEGIGFVFPFVSCWSGIDIQTGTLPSKLSDVLKKLVSEKKEIKTDEDAKGIWHIVYPYWYLEDAKIQVYCRVDYDPGKGRAGAILSVQIGNGSDVLNLEKEPKYSFDLVQRGDFWVPKRVKVQFDYDKSGKPSKYQIISFDNFKVNCELTSSDFHIDWQRGTNLYDHVTGSFYIVTGDPVNEAEAVRAFKDIHGLNRPSVFEDYSRALYFRIVLIVLGLSLIFYALYSRYKKKKNVP